MLSPTTTRLRLARPALALTILTALGVGALLPAAEAKSRSKANFTLVIDDDEQVVNAGETAVYAVRVRRTSGFRSAVSFSLSGVPAGAAAQVQPLSSGAAALQIQTSPSMPTSSTVGILVGRSGSRSRSVLFRLTVIGRPVTTLPPPPPPPVTVPQPPPTVISVPPPTLPPPTVPVNFGLRSETPERTANTGETVAYTIAVDRSSGYNGPVTFSIAGLPRDARGSFAPNPTVLGTTLYVTPGSQTPSGGYALQVIGTNGSLTRTTTVLVNVRQQLDFALSVSPPTLNVPAGTRAQFLIEVRPFVAGTAGNVSLSVTGLPAGSRASLSKVASNGLATLVVDTNSRTVAGNYPLTLTGKSNDIVRSVNFVLGVQNTIGFGLSADPSSVVVARGSGATIGVSISRIGGFNSPIAFTIGGLPAPIQWAAAVGSNVATVTINVPAGSPTGTFPVTITGTSTSLSATVQIQVTVT